MTHFAPTITADMKVAEIIQLFPAASEIMSEYGLHCYSCDIGGVESLTEGCKMHGFDDDMIGALVEDLNESIEAQTEKPDHILITLAAAKALQAIADEAENATEFLAILPDDQGGFCLEFRTKPLKEESTFTVDGATINFCVSQTTLWQIGGSRIDFRDSVFKLDLFEGGECCGGKSGESECGCK